MSAPLATYLHDHLSASNGATELLRTLRDHHTSDDLGPFADALLNEIEAERVIVEALLVAVGGRGAGFKEMVGWVAEKAGRFKSRSTESAFGVFESLELLLVGISGKTALWHALGHVALTDVRLQGPNYGALIASTEQQRLRVDERRMAWALPALADEEAISSKR